MRSITTKALTLCFMAGCGAADGVHSQTLHHVDVFRDAAVVTWKSEVHPGGNVVALSLHSNRAEDVMLFGSSMNERGALRLEEGLWWPDGTGTEWTQQGEALNSAGLELQLKYAQRELVEEDLALLRANRSVAGTSEPLLVEDLSDVADWIHKETKELLFRRVELKAEIDEGEERLAQLREERNQAASRPLFRWQVDLSEGASGELWTQVVEWGGQQWAPSDLVELVSTGASPSVVWHQRATVGLDLPVQQGPVPIRFHDALYAGLSERPDALPMPLGSYEVRREAPAKMSGDARAGASSAWPGMNWLVEGLAPETNWNREVALGEIEVEAMVRLHAVPAQSDVVNMRIMMPRPAAPVAQMERALLLVDGRPAGRVWLTEDGDSLRVDAGAVHDWDVERKRQAAMCSRTTLGNRIKHHRAYSITVTNRSASAGELILEEPLPVSRQAEIEVVPESLDGGVLEQATGILRWRLALSAGESRTVQFAYDLSHSRDQAVPDFD